MLECWWYCLSPSFSYVERYMLPCRLELTEYLEEEYCWFLPVSRWFWDKDWTRFVALFCWRFWLEHIELRVQRGYPLHASLQLVQREKYLICNLSSIYSTCLILKFYLFQNKMHTNAPTARKSKNDLLTHWAIGMIYKCILMWITAKRVKSIELSILQL